MNHQLKFNPTWVNHAQAFHQLKFNPTRVNHAQAFGDHNNRLYNMKFHGIDTYLEVWTDNWVRDCNSPLNLRLGYTMVFLTIQDSNHPRARFQSMSEGFAQKIKTRSASWNRGSRCPTTSTHQLRHESQIVHRDLLRCQWCNKATYLLASYELSCSTPFFLYFVFFDFVQPLHQGKSLGMHSHSIAPSNNARIPRHYSLQLVLVAHTTDAWIVYVDLGWALLLSLAKLSNALPSYLHPIDNPTCVMFN